MDDCVFCGKPLHNGEALTKLTLKGCDGIARACVERNETAAVAPGQQIHTLCRNNFINKNCIQRDKRKLGQEDS